MVKNLSAMQGLIPGLGRSPGGGQATHSSTLAWRIPWTGEPGGLQSMGLQRVGHDKVTAAAAYCILLLPESEASLGTLFKNLESMILSKFAIVVFVFS